MTLTRSERLKKKRGRPRSDGPRTESGQLSRSKEEPADMVARIKRMQLFGLTYEQSNQPKASTFIGRLNMEGDITNDQYNAIDRLLVAKALYFASIDPPDSLAKRTSGPRLVLDAEEEGKRAAAILERYKGAMKTLIQLQHSFPSEKITMARENCIFNDCSMPELIGEIRLIANALQRYWERNK